VGKAVRPLRDPEQLPDVGREDEAHLPGRAAVERPFDQAAGEEPLVGEERATDSSTIRDMLTLRSRASALSAAISSSANWLLVCGRRGW
jgi:hypothetical protein